MTENYYVDSTTKNKSFVLVSEELRKRGVENNDFMLALFDQQLKGVDPYNPHLCYDTKAAIRKECEINPWYFLREVYRIDEDTPFVLNLGTCAQAWCYFNNIDSWLCLPRQRGATANSIALGTWALLFDPEFYRIIFKGTTRQINETLLVSFTGRGGYIPVYLTRGTPISINTSSPHPYVWRECNKSGKTTIITDSAEFQPFPLMPGIFEKSAMDTDCKCKNLYCSTPGDLADKNAETWSTYFLRYTVRWEEKFYDMTPSEFDDYIKILYPVHCGTVYIEYGLIDLGVSLKDALRLLFCIPETTVFRREGLLQRFNSSEIEEMSIEEMERLLRNLYKVSKGEK